MNIGLLQPDGLFRRASSLVTPQGWALRLTTALLVAVAFVVLHNLHLLASTSLPILLALLLAAWCITSLAFSFWPSGCTALQLQLRLGTETGALTTIMYATGWGPVLLIGYMYMAADNIRASGSRAMWSSLLWATAGATAGQAAVLLGIAPTIVPEPAVHGLAMLSLLGNGLAIYLFGSAVGLQERSEAEVRRLNAELEERARLRTTELDIANREMESFSYSVSHDLRAPLRSLQGFAQILIAEHAAALPPETRRLVEILGERAQQMRLLIDGLLELSRSSQQPLTRRAVLPNEIVRDALRDLEAELSGRRVEMRIADLPSCEADPVLLHQVFSNLLSNAVKFTRERPVATIEVGSIAPEQDSEPVVYFVADNGAGFDMAYANKLFHVFQRLHSADAYEGNGVGLAIVQRVITRHGGSVWAHAEPGKGATFSFTLQAKSTDSC